MHVMPRVGAALSFSRSFLLKSSGAKNWPLGGLKVPKVKRNLSPLFQNLVFLVVMHEFMPLCRGDALVSRSADKIVSGFCRPLALM